MKNCHCETDNVKLAVVSMGQCETAPHIKQAPHQVANAYYCSVPECVSFCFWILPPTDVPARGWAGAQHLRMGRRAQWSAVLPAVPRGLCRQRTRVLEQVSADRDVEQLCVHVHRDQVVAASNGAQAELRTGRGPRAAVSARQAV